MYAARTATYLPGMGLRHVALVTILTLTGSTLVVGPADARRPAEALDGSHFPFTYTTTVPPGGFSMVATPPLPRSAEVLKVTVKPQEQADQEEKELFDLMFTRVGKMKRKGDRLLTCLRFHMLVLQDENSESADFSAENTSLAILVLAACLQAAGLLERDGPPAARRSSAAESSAARKCARDGYGLPAELTKTADGWKISVDGKPKDLTKPKLRVGCRVRGHTLTYKVRAATKGKPLRRVVGKRFGLGLQSPPDADTGVPVKITFATP